MIRAYHAKIPHVKVMASHTLIAGASLVRGLLGGTHSESLAEGGKVDHFCSTNRAHNKDCEYYADGGDAGLDGLPPGFVLDQSNQPTQVPSGTYSEDPIASLPEGFQLDEDKPQPPPGFELDEDRYTTTDQQIGAGVEGALQGFAGPIPTAFELGLSKLGVPGVSAQDIAEREKQNPGIHADSEAGGLAANFIPVVGEVGLLGKAAKVFQVAKAAEEASLGAKLGASALNNAIQAGLFQASDEATKAMLGQGHPRVGVAGKLADAGANIFESAVGGGILGGVTSGFGLGLNKLTTDSKLINQQTTKIYSLLSGIGEAAKGIAHEDSLARRLNVGAYDAGQKILE